MKCLILAAGYATRLYPLTENFPKPLLKVGEKTILDWLADDIAPAVDGFVVVTNHKFADHFRDWARTRGAQPVAVEYVLQKQGNEWKVFDIVVMGTSLVINYRNTFE